MDVLVTVSLFVLAVAVLVIGVMLNGIAAEIKRTRQAVERLGTEAPQATIRSGVSLDSLEQSPAA